MLDFPVLGTTVAGDEELAVWVVFIIEAVHGLLGLSTLGVVSLITRVKFGGGELLATVVTVVHGQRIATQVGTVRRETCGIVDGLLILTRSRSRSMGYE